MTRSSNGDDGLEGRDPEGPRPQARKDEGCAGPAGAVPPGRTAADERLLAAVLAPRRKGALRQIADACAAGADPNGRIPEDCDASGPVRPGSTLLTQAIQDATRSVRAGAWPG
jgi:hypothetical protein